jgi:uroporphyrin-3 C-methyltransferase
MNNTMSEDHTAQTTVREDAALTKPNGRFMASLACLLGALALLGTGGLAYYWYSQYPHFLREQSRLQTAQAQLTNQLVQYHERQTDLTQQLDTQRQQVKQLRDQLSQSAQMRQWQRIGNFITLANDQAVFMHDATQAIALLTTASKLVAHAQLPQWSALSTALHQDIDALQSTNPVNLREGLSQLSVLDGQLDQLPFRTPNTTVNAMTQAMPGSPPPVLTEAKWTTWAFWKAHLLQIWHALRGLLVIRHDEGTVIPLIDSQQQIYLRQNMHLLVFQAKWAMMSQDNTLYHDSLKSLEQLVHDDVNLQSPLTKTALLAIERLQSLVLTASLPAPQASLTAWQAIQSQRNHATTQPDRPIATLADQPTSSMPASMPASSLPESPPAPGSPHSSGPAEPTATEHTLETINA